MEDMYLQGWFSIKSHLAIGRYLKIGDLIQWLENRVGW